MTSSRLKTVDQLVAAGLVDREHALQLSTVAEQYSVMINQEMLELISNEPNDSAIHKQFVPSIEELTTTASERADPIGDDAHEAVKGVVHRYPDRCLLKPIHVCAVYCRFCFRREVVGPGSMTLSESELAAAYDYIASHPEIWEVILTGGDPFMLPVNKLKTILQALAAISTVEVIRIHSRIPIVEPSRISTECVNVLRECGKTVYVVVHCNHPNELTAEAEAAVARLVDNGIPLLSQSVLLKGINDDVETLTQLMRCFVRHRIKPYYLHHGDLAKGTSHFRTTLEAGQSLARQLWGRVSGLCQPTYVLDIPGGYGKTPINASYCQPQAADPERYQIADYQGNWHQYPPDLP